MGTDLNATDERMTRPERVQIMADAAYVKRYVDDVFTPELIKGYLTRDENASERSEAEGLPGDDRCEVLTSFDKFVLRLESLKQTKANIGLLRQLEKRYSQIAQAQQIFFEVFTKHVGPSFTITSYLRPGYPNSKSAHSFACAIDIAYRGPTGVCYDLREKWRKHKELYSSLCERLVDADIAFDQLLFERQDQNITTSKGVKTLVYGGHVHLGEFATYQSNLQRRQFAFLIDSVVNNVVSQNFLPVWDQGIESRVGATNKKNTIVRTVDLVLSHLGDEKEQMTLPKLAYEDLNGAPLIVAPSVKVK